MESIINTVDYSRQEALDSILSNTMREGTNEVHIIVGCGGVGYWAGLLLAMLGKKNFILIEGQKIDNSNLNRLPVPPSWVGINKAVALRKQIRTMRLDTKIIVLGTHITKDTLCIFDDLLSNFKTESYYAPSVTIWDTTDNAHIQKEISAKAQSVNRYTYRKIGYEAFDIGSYSNMDVWTADDYTPGYQTTNANAVTSAISAGMGIFARYLIPTRDFTVNLHRLLENGMSTPSHPKSDAYEEVLSVLTDWDSNIGDDFRTYIMEEGLL